MAPSRAGYAGLIFRQVLYRTWSQIPGARCVIVQCNITDLGVIVQKNGKRTPKPKPAIRRKAAKPIEPVSAPVAAIDPVEDPIDGATYHWAGIMLFIILLAAFAASLMFPLAG